MPARKSKKTEDVFSPDKVFDAINLLSAEKGIPPEEICAGISEAIVTAQKKALEDQGRFDSAYSRQRKDSSAFEDVVRCVMDPAKREMKVYIVKNVVNSVSDPRLDILPEDAAKYRPGAVAGETVEVPLDPRKFSRIVAYKVKHMIQQGVRDHARRTEIEEFEKLSGMVVNAKILSVDQNTGHTELDLGSVNALLAPADQVPGERLVRGDYTKVYIEVVREILPDGTAKPPRIIVSRTSPEIVRKAFEDNVPEIADGTVLIRNVARDAGKRSKIAVVSMDDSVDAVGACIGQHGSRVASIVNLLHGEEIDIVPWSEDRVEFLKAALAPADVLSVEITDENGEACRVVVPDDQLSLAIGKKGQNASLAVRLTGWKKIDIVSENDERLKEV